MKRYDELDDSMQGMISKRDVVSVIAGVFSVFFTVGLAIYYVYVASGLSHG